MPTEQPRTILATSPCVFSVCATTMAGSDPTESVTHYQNRDFKKNNTSNKFIDKDCHVVNIFGEDEQDESTPIATFHQPAGPDPSATSSASLLSITKTLRQLAVAAACLVLSVLFNLTVLSVIHERVPMGQPPLPDVTFALLPKIDRALDISEYIIMFMTSSVLVLIIIHRYRSIVFRRLCLILSVLYFLRAISMAVTQLPLANPQYYCSPQLNMTENFGWWNLTKTIASRVSHMSLGMGLSVNGRHSFCGDYIFSGHTIMLVILCNFIDEYWLSSRQGFQWRCLKWFYFGLACIGVLCILISRGHYMVDIFLAYFISTRVFFIYHCACENALRSDPSKRYKQIWWHTLFSYVESDTIKHQIQVQNVFEMSELYPNCFRPEKS